MNTFHAGALPRSLDRNGERVYGDNHLVHEAATIIRGTINSAGHRWKAAGGFHADYDWLRSHLDEDNDLTARVLAQAGFIRKNGVWLWGRGVWSFSKITDLDALGDLLVTAVNTHRPI